MRRRPALCLFPSFFLFLNPLLSKPPALTLTKPVEGRQDKHVAMCEVRGRIP